MKTCTKCKIEKPITEFHKCSKYDSGRISICKTCKTEHQRAKKAIADGFFNVHQMEDWLVSKTD